MKILLCKKDANQILLNTSSGIFVSIIVLNINPCKTLINWSYICETSFGTCLTNGLINTHNFFLLLRTADPPIRPIRRPLLTPMVQINHKCCSIAESKTQRGRRTWNFETGPFQTISPMFVTIWRLYYWWKGKKPSWVCLDADTRVFYHSRIRYSSISQYLLVSYGGTDDINYCPAGHAWVIINYV